MKRGYIQSINSVIAFQGIVTKMNAAGVESDNIVINKSFVDFAKTVNDGDTVVVYSLDYFKSLSELINTTIELFDRGILLESLTDSWYNVTKETIPLLKGVIELSTRIFAVRTQAGLDKAKAQGKTLGRPVGSSNLKEKIAAVEKLQMKSNIGITQACKIVGCNPRSYYRHLEKTGIQ